MSASRDQMCDKLRDAQERYDEKRLELLKEAAAEYELFNRVILEAVEWMGDRNRKHEFELDWPKPIEPEPVPDVASQFDVFSAIIEQEEHAP